MVCQQAAQLIAEVRHWHPYRGYRSVSLFFFIVDRKKDCPRELEEGLCSHPAVREAATIGVPHESLGEDVGAVAVLGKARMPRRVNSGTT